MQAKLNEAIALIPSTSKKILLITYTNKGVEALKTEYSKQNCGVVDERADIKTWYQFLLAEMIKPYQSYIFKQENLVRSIDFTSMYGKPNYKKRGTKEHYLNRHNDVLVNAASELAVDCNTISDGKVIKRLEKVYAHIFIDEIQDIAGSDLDLLNLFLKSSISVTCVGDYKQATFRTHNAKKNRKVTGVNIIDHFNDLERKGVLEMQYNKMSRRFNQEICDFSNTIFGDDNEIETTMVETCENDGVYLLPADVIEEYIAHYHPVILKYDITTDTLGHISYNFGACKGMTFERTLIFPNGVFLSFLKGKELNSPSKYYVASTRSKYSIGFVVDELFETTNFKATEIEIGNKKIKVCKYSKGS